MLSLLFGLAASAGCFFDDEIVAMTTLRFASNAAIIDDEADLDEVAALGRVDGAVVCVTGHADDVGDDDENLALGRRRAAAVASALLARGVAVDRLRVETIGEHDPVVRANDDVMRARNRRVVVTVRLPTPPIPAEPDNDVLDQPLSKTEAVTTPRAPVLKTRRRAPPPPSGWIDDIDPQWRRSAGALVVGTGAACGAGVALGLCCLAPFSAPFGSSVAAEAIGAAAEPDALAGATAGAALGSLIGAGAGAIVGVLVADNERDRVPTAFGAALLTSLPATVLGAGVGAAVGWWLSPSGLHAAAPIVQNPAP